MPGGRSGVQGSSLGMAANARSRSRGAGSRQGGPGVGISSRGGVGPGGDNASLFDVVHGTSASRAMGARGQCK